MLEIILADACSGLNLNSGEVAVLVLDNEVYLAPVDVPILVERTGRQIDLRGQLGEDECLDKLPNPIGVELDE